MTEDMNHLLDTMIEEGAWDSDLATLSGHWREAWEETISEAVDREEIDIPEDFVTFYARTCGAKFSIGNIYVFSLYVLEDVHQKQDWLFKHIPSALFFASDGGDRFFFIDTDGSLGQGKGAVFLGARGSMRPDWCIPCGRSLEAFLEAVMANKEVWKGPKLEALAVEKMIAALQTQKHRCRTHPGARLKEVFAVLHKFDVRAPKVLQALLRYSNGIVFTDADVTIWPAASIRALDIVESSDDRAPLALLIGENASGALYAITTDMIMSKKAEDWPERVGHIVRVTTADPTTPLDSLGYLPEVVVRWLSLNA